MKTTYTLGPSFKYQYNKQPLLVQKSIWDNDFFRKTKKPLVPPPDDKPSKLNLLAYKW